MEKIFHKKREIDGKMWMIRIIVLRALIPDNTRMAVDSESGCPRLWLGCTAGVDLVQPEENGKWHPLIQKTTWQLFEKLHTQLPSDSSHY